jgi:hypothetical protein
MIGVLGGKLGPRKDRPELTHPLAEGLAKHA